MAGEVNKPKPHPRSTTGTLHVTWAYHYKQANPVATKDYQLKPGIYSWGDINPPAPLGRRVFVFHGSPMTNPGGANPSSFEINRGQTTTLNVLVM